MLNVGKVIIHYKNSFTSKAAWNEIPLEKKKKIRNNCGHLSLKLLQGAHDLNMHMTGTCVGEEGPNTTVPASNIALKLVSTVCPF